MQNIQNMKKSIEELRVDLNSAIESKEDYHQILRISRKLDLLITSYHHNLQKSYIKNRMPIQAR